MKRYRIIEKSYSDGEKEYYVQYKVLKLFWIDLRCHCYFSSANNENLYHLSYDESIPKTSSYEEALNMLKWMMLSNNCFIGVDDKFRYILYLYTNDSKLFGNVYGSYDYNKAVNLFNKYDKELKKFETKKVVYEC